MKKIQVLIISLLFLISNVQASLFQAPNPYSFGPEGRAVADLRNFATPKQMVSILPNRPVVATDSQGNRVYYTPDGKMTLSISKDGSMSFSVGGTTKQADSEGTLTGTIRTIQGSGLWQEIRNESEQLLGYKVLNGDGKVAETYDKDKNKTATYVYDGQGAKLSYIVNEMTGGRTIFDEYERTKAEVDADGFVLATYQYQDVSYGYGEDSKTITETQTDSSKGQGLLVTKKTYELDIKGEVTFSTTFFDLEGAITHVTNSKGLIVSTYFYRSDGGSNKVIDYVLDNLTKNKTFYDGKGTQTHTVNDQGATIVRYYDGYTVNIAADGSYSETTKYDIDGTELYTTFKNIVYNEDGTIDEVMGNEDEVWEKYYYTTNSEGKKIIDYVENLQDKTKTYYNEEGKQKYTKNSSGEIIKDFSWNGNTLVYTFDRQSQTTQWYNMDKELVYETFNERIITKNIYSFGQLVGKWDAQSKTLTILINERNWISVKADSEPNVDSIKTIIANAAAVEEKYKNKNKDLDDTNINSLLSDMIAKQGVL